jgi:hypothetical protein
MARTTIRICLAALCLGTLLVAFSMDGCSRAADRTLTIRQFQSADTYAGQFKIDVSQLPPGAIKERADSGSEGAPVTSITIDIKYPIRVVLVPVTDDRPSPRKTTTAEGVSKPDAHVSKPGRRPGERE